MDVEADYTLQGSLRPLKMNLNKNGVRLWTGCSFAKALVERCSLWSIYRPITVDRAGESGKRENRYAGRSRDDRFSNPLQSVIRLPLVRGVVTTTERIVGAGRTTNAGRTSAREVDSD